MCPDAEMVLRAFSADAWTNTCCPSSVATHRNVPQPGQAPRNPITEKDEPRPGGAEGRKQERPSLMRLAMSVFQSRPVNKMDESSLNEAPFPLSCVNTVVSLLVLLTSASCPCLPPSGSGPPSYGFQACDHPLTAVRVSALSSVPVPTGCP